MKALILVGGFGTRLRPLTFTKPKPLVEFCNKAIVLHQIEALAAVGVKHVVLAVNYKPEAMMEALNQMAKKYGIEVSCSLETEPLGTAGPLALARELLRPTPEDNTPFFVFNSDVICPYPLKDLVAFHTAHGKEGTILVKRVGDPSKYGVVVAQEDGLIDRFVEKPKKFVGDCINAGMYIFNPSILDRIQPKPTSIEREIFPEMVKDGQLYSMVLDGYWMDIGQPKDYLTGMCLHLDHLAGRSAEGGKAEEEEGFNADSKVIIHPTATVHEDAVVGPHVVIGPNCVVEAGARVTRSCLLGNSTVKSHSFVKSTIVGWHSSVGKWARCENVTVLGEHVTIKDTVALNGVRVLPHKGVGASILAEGTIVM